MATSPAAPPTPGIAPIVIDLGKQKRKRIRQLKRGRGRLLDDVGAAVEQVRTRLGGQAAGRELVPIVLIYRKKQRGKGWLFPFGR